MTHPSGMRLAHLRRHIHVILDDAAVPDRLGRYVHRSLVLLVTVSVASVVLESVPEFQMLYGHVFLIIEYVAMLVFSVEYGLRLWSAPEHTVYHGLSKWRARLQFALSASAMIDLIAIAPFFLVLFVPADLRVVLILRLVRYFKLARYSPGMRSLMAALEAERKALLASGVILLGLVLVTASAMHLAEHAVQPEKFGSIPAAMWWAIVTLTTVGYGDVVPVTLLGRLIAGFTMVMGLMMLALPVGIIATAFADEIHRREFVVTWGMVSRVPLFSELNAGEIADVMRYLRAQTVPAGALIVRRGELAHSMYFIASGYVEVELPKARIRLTEGQFFGEMAVIRQTRRTASIRALEPTKLLILDALDLAVLIAHKPDLGQRIEQVVRERAEVQMSSDGEAQEGGPQDAGFV